MYFKGYKALIFLFMLVFLPPRFNMIDHLIMTDSGSDTHIQNYRAQEIRYETLYCISGDSGLTTRKRHFVNAVTFPTAAGMLSCVQFPAISYVCRAATEQEYEV